VVGATVPAPSAIVFVDRMTTALAPALALLPALLALPYAAHAQEQNATRDARWSACTERLTLAREELLAQGFDPSDDTPHWLRVEPIEAGGVRLWVYTVASADGDGHQEWRAEFRPSRSSMRAGRWIARERRGRDEFREAFIERTRVRHVGHFVATVSVHTILEADHDQQRNTSLFVDVVRAALDDCLAAGL
jgi:hypothetical protein